MFTDRFIKLPIKEYNSQVKEITGREGELRSNWEKINPFEIQSYRPNPYEEGTLILTLKYREAFTVYLHVIEFENLLNKQF